MYLKSIVLLCLFSATASADQLCIDTSMNPNLSAAHKTQVATASTFAAKDQIYRLYPTQYASVINSCNTADNTAQANAAAAQKKIDDARRTAAANGTAAAPTTMGETLVTLAPAIIPIVAKALPDKDAGQSTAAKAADLKYEEMKNGKPAATGTPAAAAAPAQQAATVAASAAPAAASAPATTAPAANVPTGPNESNTSKASLNNQSTPNGTVADQDTFNRSPSVAGSNNVATLSDSLAKDMPGVKTGTDAVKESSEVKPSMFDPKTEITELSNKQLGELQEAAKIARAKLETLLGGGVNDGRFVKAYPKMTAILREIETFTSTTKNACTKSTETAGFLCADGTSPGAKATKLLMNVAGPILAVINSAQKSCSSLSKISSLAAAGLTVAKGVCMTSKYMCDSSCETASKQIKKISTELEALNTDIAAEANVMMGEYNCAEEIKVVCIKIEKAPSAATAALRPLMLTVQYEATTKPGSVASLAVKCESNMMDIATMGLNIVGLVKAASNAKKCDDELSSNGGSTVTTQQYCENPANASGETCRCFKDSTAKGCANAVVTNENGTTDNNVAGTNIKTGAGVSGFATGGVKPTTGSGVGSGGSGSGVYAPYESPKYGGWGGSGSSAGGAAAPSDSSVSAGSPGATDAAKAAKDSKKWDFGAFSSLSGGGGSGSATGGRNVNGSGLGEKEMEALQRKIASEQVAAEVSPASGKSNWEKVKSMYILKENSLLFGK